MNTWRNQIRERVRVLFPVQREERGTLESAAGVPSLKYLASMMNLSSTASAFDEDKELMQLLQDRMLLMFFHPSALHPKDIARYIHDCMRACEEMNAHAGAWPPPNMPEPPVESAMLIFAKKIATHDIDRIARLVPLDGTSWAFRMRATSSSLRRPNDDRSSPILVIDTSSPELPPLARWALSAPGEDEALEDVLEDETLPADMRERIVAYAAARLNAEVTRRVLSQVSPRSTMGGAQSAPRRN